MIRALTLSVPLLVATAFAAFVPIGEIFSAVQPMMVTLSVMTAAVLVRLNRGMPTLDWKSLAVIERKNLTQSILLVTQEYLRIAAIFTASIIYLLFLNTLGRDRAIGSIFGSKVLSGASGFILSICIIRMSYVAWRDYDIVRLQKFVIDDAADREQVGLDKAEAIARLESMRTAGLKSTKGLPPSKMAD